MKIRTILIVLFLSIIPFHTPAFAQRSKQIIPSVHYFCTLMTRFVIVSPGKDMLELHHGKGQEEACLPLQDILVFTGQPDMFDLLASLGKENNGRVVFRFYSAKGRKMILVEPWSPLRK
jgi:hypothetical protein